MDLSNIRETLDDMSIYLGAELKEINLGLRKPEKKEPDYDFLYEKLGNVISDLSLFFYQYPSLLDQIRSMGNSVDRSIKSVYENTEKNLVERYYSFLALKDLSLGLERIIRAMLYKLQGME